ncbi:hypothetical protein SAMN04487895_109283 [Paenibacillus sophorae]|uniref:Uncharacterized protein n=1 Tax=Paenibacillus sophorae TaxID=1333845 RepID=A0A1H8RF51_9BACL|nr:hypothetical protein SAMN04487895_109283 [Paenibacillus sophorae]
MKARGLFAVYLYACTLILAGHALKGGPIYSGNLYIGYGKFYAPCAAYFCYNG